jgi:hypothetical protein
MTKDGRPRSDRVPGTTNQELRADDRRPMTKDQVTKDKIPSSTSIFHDAVPVPQITKRIVCLAAYGTTGEIAWRATRYIAPGATRSAAFPAVWKAVRRATGKAEKAAHREAVVETALRAVTETVFSTEYDTAFSVAPRAYLGAVPQPVPQPIRGVVPWAGVPFAGLKPKAASPKQLGRKGGSDK